MELRRLGRSNLEVSVLSLGCWALGGDATWGPQDRAASIATVHASLDAGINFFDTAEAYSNGLSEEILGEALGKRRAEAIIATKVSGSRLKPEQVIEACENSLRRLGTDYIDVYYIHWPSRDVPIADTLGAMERLKEQGKIRVAAVSNFGKQSLTELLQLGRVEANQLAYNLLFRAIEHEIQEVCIANEVSITCYSSLAQGLLTGKFSSPDEVPEGRARTRHFSSARPQTRHGEPGAEKETFETIDRIRRICDRYGLTMEQAALGWLLKQPGVASVIVGARNPEQVMRNVRAVHEELPAAAVAELTEATEELKERLGPNADMWESAATSRVR